MTTSAALENDQEGGARRAGVGAVGGLGLAVACLAAGFAPLAARSIPNPTIEIAYGLVLAAAYLAFTLIARRSSSLERYWTLSFAFFAFALVQVLNNSIPSFVLTNILHEQPVTGNPLASTVTGTAVIQLVEAAIAIVPIVVLVPLAGLRLGSVYARIGKVGRMYLFAVGTFVAVYLFVGLAPSHRYIPINGTLTFARYLALSPALLVMALSNGFEEEFLFRGLFLQRYAAFLGVWAANILQALVFSSAHLGVTYSPNALVFIVLTVFPLGLVAGYLMRRSDTVVVPAIFHAALDIPIYLAFLTYVG